VGEKVPGILRGSPQKKKKPFNKGEENKPEVSKKGEKKRALKPPKKFGKVKRMGLEWKKEKEFPTNPLTSPTPPE